MPAHQKFYDQLTAAIIVARAKGDQKQVDKLLDLWWATKHQATEWDADRWGFDPDRWQFQMLDLIARNKITHRDNY